ncbi:hypothetical protein HQ45_02795 [Porphyromonas crevioricanis]|uniref:PASTA domain n=2 Tax=Porphyromonas crevioricanis TaxID=393921 RepID=A0A0A2G2C1_9PORP|nr:PASTA domain-containing protein [Porphyromonas crevioricanis]KGN91045.1 hypothetical protein HQ45_02795 [Porphyromonas crevioricanis]KGN94639.1 hypothetical protein HQ38_05505 [Porphyromonas crevioricanis]SJZ57050.1 PASTA domain-containing protein [Porphyromonas crevioricanis]SQH73396.1 PASTA domain [Porphyromonas crevioricanis]GAD05357.1 hypothetical protein PORCRE_1057 [Porphyromonas crevioricanis JCM 15906]
MNSTKKKFISKHPILSSLLLMLVLSLLIVFVLGSFTDIYTSHGQEREVPMLKGLTQQQAVEKLETLDLKCEVVDSVHLGYNRNVLPGAIVESVPEAGSKVKPGRIIFLTVNAFSPQKGTIPDLKDLSLRQAVSVLKSIGFTNVRQRYISGDFLDLVSAVETADGREIRPGDRIALSDPLVLVVIRGGFSLVDSLQPELESVPDSMTVEEEGPRKNDREENESWW